MSASPVGSPPPEFATPMGSPPAWFQPVAGSRQLPPVPLFAPSPIAPRIQTPQGSPLPSPRDALGAAAQARAILQGAVRVGMWQPGGAPGTLGAPKDSSSQTKFVALCKEQFPDLQRKKVREIWARALDEA